MDAACALRTGKGIAARRMLQTVNAENNECCKVKLQTPEIKNKSTTVAKSDAADNAVMKMFDRDCC